MRDYCSRESGVVLFATEPWFCEETGSVLLEEAARIFQSCPFIEKFEIRDPFKYLDESLEVRIRIKGFSLSQLSHDMETHQGLLDEEGEEKNTYLLV